MTKADSVHSGPRRFTPKIVGGTTIDPAVPPNFERCTKTADVNDPIFDAIEACREAKRTSDAANAKVSQLYELAEKSVGPNLKACNAFIEMIIGDDPDDYTNGPASALWDSYEDFAETVPTTLAGLQAMLAFADEVTAHDADAFNEVAIFSTFATAAKALNHKACMRAIEPADRVKRNRQRLQTYRQRLGR
jgi:hypothetical protein